MSRAGPRYNGPCRPLETGLWLEIVLGRYIEISIYRVRYRYIVSYRYRPENIDFFDISRYYLFIAIIVFVRNELSAFLNEPIIIQPPTATENAASSDRTVIDSCSSLQWWSQHRSRYPSLVPVVRMLFGVPATSVPSERLFSKAGLVISDRRSRLSPQHAEQQCFMSCNWRD